MSAKDEIKKAQVLAKIGKSWDDFKSSYVGLPDEQMLQPGVTESWSVKDILAHVSWWEEETLKHLPGMIQGERAERYSDLYGGIDAFNAQMTGEWKELPLEEVRKRMEDTHYRLIEYLQGVPDEQFSGETRFRRRLRLDTYSHYPIHEGAIREWREKMGL